MDDHDYMLLVRARRWRQQFLRQPDGDEVVYQLVTDLEAALRAHVEQLPVA